MQDEHANLSCMARLMISSQNERAPHVQHCLSSPWGLLGEMMMAVRALGTPPDPCSRASHVVQACSRQRRPSTYGQAGGRGVHELNIMLLMSRHAP